jgi:hypothetical protein
MDRDTRVSVSRSPKTTTMSGSVSSTICRQVSAAFSSDERRRFPEGSSPLPPTAMCTSVGSTATTKGSDQATGAISHRTSHSGVYLLKLSPNAVRCVRRASGARQRQQHGYGNQPVPRCGRAAATAPAPGHRNHVAPAWRPHSLRDPTARPGLSLRPPRTRRGPQVAGSARGSSQNIESPMIWSIVGRRTQPAGR